MIGCELKYFGEQLDIEDSPILRKFIFCDWTFVNTFSSSPKIHFVNHCCYYTDHYQYHYLWHFGYLVVLAYNLQPFH